MNRMAMMVLVLTIWAMVGLCAAETRININTATAMELQTLPGIGPGMAQLIVDFRQTNGPFQSI